MKPRPAPDPQPAPLQPPVPGPVRETASDPCAPLPGSAVRCSVSGAWPDLDDLPRDLSDSRRETVSDLSTLATWMDTGDARHPDWDLVDLVNRAVSHDHHSPENSPARHTPLNQVDRYQLRQLLNAGGQGTVYLGWDPLLRREVAVKIAHDACDDALASALPLGEEGMLLARISHPGLAQVYDCGWCAGRLYLVMEYVAGTNLAEYRRSHQWSARAARRILEQVAQATAAAHRHGILHLDLKPDNVLAMACGRCKLIDFGMGALLSTLRDIPVNLAAGTPEFMSPEQRSGDPRRWSAASDVFGLGALGYWLLIGEPPLPPRLLEEDELHSLLRQAQERLCRETIDVPLARLCRRALEFEPGDRWPSAAEFAGALTGKDRRQLQGKLCLLAGGLSLLAAGSVSLMDDKVLPAPRTPAMMMVPIPVDAGSRPRLELRVATLTPRTPQVLIWSPRLGLTPIYGLDHRSLDSINLWEPHGNLQAIQLETTDSLWFACCLPDRAAFDRIDAILRRLHVRTNLWTDGSRGFKWEDSSGTDHLQIPALTPQIQADLNWLSGELGQLECEFHCTLLRQPEGQPGNIAFSLSLPGEAPGQRIPRNRTVAGELEH